MSKVVLLYPPQQTHPSHAPKPEASLAYPYLAGSLLQAGHEVHIYDACVGNHRDPPDIFYHHSQLDSGLLRHGVSDDRILQEVEDADVVGITSIFTAQESIALHVGSLVKKHYPKKLLVTGGTNARNRADKFLFAGFDVVCTSEAETNIVEIADHPAAFKQKGMIEQNPPTNLDLLPMPAWHLHPNDRYWKIGRPHGAPNQTEGPFAYANLMTSRGCPFNCQYCHISGEDGIARFRVKSGQRVCLELETLSDLGVKELFIEDDSLFGRKQRGIDVLQTVRDSGFHVWDINGINISHLFKGRSPDENLLDMLRDCGFAHVSLPVESASQRIIDKYASSKWNTFRHNVSTLIQSLSDRGISSGVNYMIGFPDETIQEVQATIDLARRHREAGANSINLMLVVPLPGTILYRNAIRDGHLDKDFNPDSFNWRQANLKNTTVPPEQLEEIQQSVWTEMNA